MVIEEAAAVNRVAENENSSVSDLEYTKWWNDTKVILIVTIFSPW